MARMALFVTAMAATMTFSALPLASATSPEAIDQVQPAPTAASASMISMNMCGERERLVGELENQFNESATAVGMVSSDAVVEIFVSDAGTWTIIATGTDGQSCILSAGEGWESTNVVRGVDA